MSLIISFCPIDMHLHDPDPIHHLASPKKGFVKLLKGRSKVVNYIHILMYEVSRNNDDSDRDDIDHLQHDLLSPI